MKRLISMHAGYVKAAAVSALLLALVGCGSDGGDDNTGFVKFYNASPNSPEIFLTLDEDLENDDADEFEQTFSSIGYGEALSNRELSTDTYFYEIARQDEDSTLRSDLEILLEGQLQIDNESITFLVLSGDILAPESSLFDIPVEDDEDDIDDDLFNVRFLNTVPNSSGLDVYMSKSDETFNEAVLMGTFSYLGLSDNMKLEEDQYIYYITEPGSTEVVFESTEANYPFNTQYVIVIRPNDGAGQSPYVIDSVGNSSLTTFQAADDEARFRVYNGIQLNDLLPEYTGSINVQFDGLDADQVLQIDALGLEQFSSVFTVDNGDFSLTVDDASEQLNLVNSQLFSLPENTDRTIFYYMIEEYVDEDEDGDFDEDGDGIIDEIEAKVESVVVDNSTRDQIFEHEVKMLNLAYSEDFTRVTFYFVKSDENIETAEESRIATLGTAESLQLLNNTYQVYAIANIEGTDTVLDITSLTLDEDSEELYLLLELDADSASGFSMKFVEQTVNE